ncbi:hypothetical protein WICMUC_003678 [Wickerhamomyces mucosus]|uniref:DASH complex subunit DAD3 n=1 Tax=Wickerhamomyces mucosus TaxID=1378264 RepID=A0A9P8PK94_9ASCO|nr:hypothetical protein WICMUC_003678 [Wickerhamomyces mucosus]
MTSECLTVDYTQTSQLTDLELKILQQYQNLAKRLKYLSQIIAKLTSSPSPQLLEDLRVIESKIALVFTLFKAAVYSLFLQQESVENQQQEQDQNEGIQESTQSFLT